MKQIIAGVVLIIVVGLGGFLYRNILERNAIPQPGETACTMEAKLCPDGQSVGRTGPTCAFAPCPLPNVELSSIGIAFAIPEGYAQNHAAPGGDPTLIAAFEKPGMEGSPAHAIVVRRYEIPVGGTADAVMLENTMLEPSGMQPESIEEFGFATVAGRSYRTITVERFEAQVHTVYYLARAADVLRFEVLERDVMSWTDSSLDIMTLPEHAALLRMLETLQGN
ncbi:MAG TPA: hypothetical protein VEA92_00250 [Candidatus Paceibacterota bacterium]|nr:hypothetical protein [Candidatus Paceibacterota bacterium]